MTIAVLTSINSDFCRLRRQTDLPLCGLQLDQKQVPGNIADEATGNKIT